MSDTTQPMILQLNDGRDYKLGSAENTTVTFKADGAEVANKYAITEWWMEQGGPGVDAHVHEANDELIYVLAGPVSILNGGEWEAVETGGMAIIPAGTTHGFRNDSEQRVGILNIFLNATYEAMMPQIQAMFANR